jgi:hypothetical protein
MALSARRIKALAAGKKRSQSLFSFENSGKLAAVYDLSEGDAF